MTMKVALLRPHHHSHLIQPPLALGYLAAHLRAAGHQVLTIDGLCHGLSNRDLADRCAGCGLVGISVLSDYYPQTVDLVRLLKQRGLKVVLGGPHVTVIPDHCLRESGADFAVTGEGELALTDLVQDLEGGGRGEGICGVITSETRQVNRRELVQDLDALPFPDWDQMSPATYPLAPHGGVAKSYPIAPMTSSRGCPYNCTFCSSPFLWERKIRFRSPDNVVDEIQYMVRRYGVREVHFEDDNMTMRREHAAGIAEQMLRRGLRVSWALPNGIRVDRVDRDLLVLMKRAGLYSVAFGVESADPEVLRRCNKRTSVDRIEQAIRMASEAGLITQGFFIFGLPGETAESIERTIRFATRSKLDKAQFLLLDVMPGTQIWDQMDPKPDLTKYQSYHDLTWCPEGLDPELLRRAPSRAFRTFFLSSPRRVLRMLRLMRPEQLRFVLRRMTDFRIIPARS